MISSRRVAFIVRLGEAALFDVVLVTLYYQLPLDRSLSGSTALRLVGLLSVLFVIVCWQLWSIIHSRHPGARALQGLLVFVPLFLLSFASTYVVMAHSTAGSFTPNTMTRTDAVYFTVSTFSTVGFGDITATSQAARLVVTLQMLLDLVTLGVGIRVFVAAVRRGQQRSAGDGTQAAARAE